MDFFYSLVQLHFTIDLKEITLLVPICATVDKCDDTDDDQSICKQAVISNHPTTSLAGGGIRLPLAVPLRGMMPG